MTTKNKPSLSSKGHILIVTDFPPTAGGSSVIMHNLLSYFDPTSFSIARMGVNPRHSIEDRSGAQKYSLSPTVSFSTRLDRLLQQWYLPRAEQQLKMLIQCLKPVAIIGVYPQFYHLYLTRRVSKALNIPWLAYLHDTVAEAHEGSKLSHQASSLQAQTFTEASSILVMSQGMSDLYQRKYNLKTKPLVHSYPEPFSKTVDETRVLPQAFWGGGIYSINRHSIQRISAALMQNGQTLVLATNSIIKQLTKWGIYDEHVRLDFYPKRADYLQALQEQCILILALDWPDESPVHQDELSTIFPTKTPEYLASGRPILVHCPEDYFLARFFRDNKCGLVVSERSEDALKNACFMLMQSNRQVHKMQQAALETVHMFDLNTVSQMFHEEVSAVSQLGWGEKVQ